MSIPESGDGVPLLPYESKDRNEPSGPRPWWVYGLIGVYLLLFVGVLLLPAMTVYSEGTGDPQFIWTVIISVCGLVVCGLSLMLLPIKAIRRRPVSRRSIWFPVVGSGLLAGTLLLGGGMALGELLKNTSDAAAWAILFSSIG